MDALRSHAAWQQSVRDFRWLASEVPGACDLDLCMERRGSVLILESKPWTPGVGIEVSYGQWTMLKALASQSETQTVLLVGDAGEGNLCFVRVSPDVKPVFFTNDDGKKMFLVGDGLLTRTTKQALAGRVRRWFDLASERGKTKKAA